MHSLYEIETTVKRSSRAKGLSWGLSEEAGKAVRLLEQSEKLWHVSNIYQISEQEKLARRLCEVSFADYVFFCNSGTEAVEASIKIARKYYYETLSPIFLIGKNIYFLYHYMKI